MLILGRPLPNFKYQSSGTIMKNLIMSRFREKVKQWLCTQKCYFHLNLSIRNFLKKLGPSLLYFLTLTSCKKIEKKLSWVNSNKTVTQTDGRMDRAEFLCWILFFTTMLVTFPFMYEKRYNHVPKKLLHFPRACFLGKLFPFTVFCFYNVDKNLTALME